MRLNKPILTTLLTINTMKRIFIISSIRGFCCHRDGASEVCILFYR